MRPRAAERVADDLHPEQDHSGERPSAATAIGVKTAISEKEYFVTQVPTTQTTRTTTIIGITSFLFMAGGYPSAR